MESQGFPAWNYLVPGSTVKIQFGGAMRNEDSIYTGNETTKRTSTIEEERRQLGDTTAQKRDATSIANGKDGMIMWITAVAI
jgi:hypothetical protein